MKHLILACALLFALTAHAEEIQIEHRGLTLNANLEKVEGNWPQGPVVLMTHGTLAHSGMEIMSTLQDLFQENEISSLAISLSLGLSDRHGMYDCAAPHTHQHTDALDEIGVWLAWLKNQGAEKVALLGHSRGGNQTAWFAAERDDPAVTQVLLIAPQTWSRGHGDADYEKRYGEPLEPLLAEAKKRVALGQGDDLIKEVGFIYCKDAAASASAIVSYYAPDERMDTPALLPKIAKPVLVFAGSEDDVSEGIMEAVEPMVREGALELYMVDGADHFFRDLYAEEVVETAVEFIDR
jgi:pimeloyl-ACP methyl ester carboxylesterase